MQSVDLDEFLHDLFSLKTALVIFIMTEWSTPHLKIILIGNSGVGKSSFMTRFVDHRFTNLYRATVGVDFLTKEITIDKRSVILQIWDTAGTERFHSLGTTLYRGAHCCLLVFDVTSSVSFDALEVWKKEFLVQACPSDPSGFPFIVLGNKIDLDYREVSTNKAQQWCSEIGAEYFECSAKEDIGVDTTFYSAARAALQYLKRHHVDNGEDIQMIQKQQENKPNKKCSC